MNCPKCGHEVRAGVRFCEQCGQSLNQDEAKAAAPKRKAQTKSRRGAQAPEIRIACPACGYANRAGIRFCEECGADLTVDPAAFARGRQSGPRATPQSAWGTLFLRFIGGGVFGYLASKLGILVINYVLALGQ